MTIYSTVNYLLAEGETDGKVRGLKEGTCSQLCKLLRRQGKRRFGEPSDQQGELLQALADRLDQAQLETLQGRFLSATTWAELLDGVVSTGETPAPPDYLEPYEFDPTPLPPSIDTYAQMTLANGTKAVMHMRFQRMYQKDLGSILYKEGEQLRAKYGGIVQSLVLLLWPGADGPAMTGEWAHALRAGFHVSRDPALGTGCGRDVPRPRHDRDGAARKVRPGPLAGDRPPHGRSHCRSAGGENAGKPLERRLSEHGPALSCRAGQPTAGPCFADAL